MSYTEKAKRNIQERTDHLNQQFAVQHRVTVTPVEWHDDRQGSFLVFWVEPEGRRNKRVVVDITEEDLEDYQSDPEVARRVDATIREALTSAAGVSNG
jgi:hypothetical protein